MLFVNFWWHWSEVKKSTWSLYNSIHGIYLNWSSCVLFNVANQLHLLLCLCCDLVDAQCHAIIFSSVIKNSSLSSFFSWCSSPPVGISRVTSRLAWLDLKRNQLSHLKCIETEMNQIDPSRPHSPYLFPENTVKLLKGFSSLSISFWKIVVDNSVIGTIYEVWALGHTFYILHLVIWRYYCQFRWLYTNWSFYCDLMYFFSLIERAFG